MRSILEMFWNALLTATVVTLLVGLFVAAMPPVFRATATVPGQTQNMLAIQSADLLAEVIRTTSVDIENLEGWREKWIGASPGKVNLLRSRLTVSPGERADWIEITVEAGSRETASTLANEIAREFVQRTAVNTLTLDERTRLLQQVKAADDELVQFLAAAPRLNNAALLFQRIQNDKQQVLLSLHELQQELDARLVEMKNARAGRLAGLTSPRLQQALQARDTLLRQREEIVTRYGDRHNAMVALESRIRDANASIEVERLAYIDQLTRQTARTEEQARDQRRKLQSLESEQAELERQQVRLKELELRRDTVMKGLQGVAEARFNEAFSEALPGANALGLSQAALLAAVFLVTLALMLLLMALQGKRKP